MLLDLYQLEQKFVVSRNLYSRSKAATTVDFLTPKIRDITIFYIKKFCNNVSIARDQTRLLFLRQLVKDVREWIHLPLTSKYAKILKTRMDKKEGIYE